MLSQDSLIITSMPHNLSSYRENQHLSNKHHLFIIWLHSKSIWVQSIVYSWLNLAPGDECICWSCEVYMLHEIYSLVAEVRLPSWVLWPGIWHQCNMRHGPWSPLVSTLRWSMWSKIRWKIQAFVTNTDWCWGMIVCSVINHHCPATSISWDWSQWNIFGHPSSPSSHGLGSNTMLTTLTMIWQLKNNILMFTPNKLRESWQLSSPKKHSKFHFFRGNQ